MKTQRHHNISHNFMLYVLQALIRSRGTALNNSPQTLGLPVCAQFHHLPVPCFPRGGMYTWHHVSHHMHGFYMEAHLLIRDGPTVPPPPSSHYVSGTVTQPRRGTTGSCKRFCLLAPSSQVFWPFIIMNDGKWREPSAGSPIIFCACKWLTPLQLPFVGHFSFPLFCSCASISNNPKR